MIVLVSSRQPRKPGTPPFWTEVLMYTLLVKKDVSLLERMEKNIFPSTLSNEIVLNWLTVFEFCSFGIDKFINGRHEESTPNYAVGVYVSF